MSAAYVAGSHVDAEDESSHDPLEGLDLPDEDPQSPGEPAQESNQEGDVQPERLGVLDRERERLESLPLPGAPMTEAKRRETWRRLPQRTNLLRLQDLSNVTAAKRPAPSLGHIL